MSKIYIKRGRLAFAQAVFEPKAFQGEGKKDYNCAILIDPETPWGKEALDAIAAETEAVAKAKWGEAIVEVGKAKTKMPKWKAVLKELENNDRLATHDGNKKSFAGYEDNIFVNIRSDTKPLIIDRDRSRLTAEDGVIYSGCYVIAQIELWAQDNSFGKRINATFKGLQYYGPGDAFSGAGPAASEDEFEDLGDLGEDEVEDDASDLT